VALDPGPNPLSEFCDEHLAVDSESMANVQECHLVAVHLICAALDEALLDDSAEAEGEAILSSPIRQAAEAETSESSLLSLARRRPVNLVVVGDVLLDKDITGFVERISPEAPVPVVGSLQHTVRPGGAGLTAYLAAERGHHVTLVTALSGDEEATVARTMLAAAGVTVVDLGTCSATAVKTRVRARQQTLLMLDSASPAGPLGALGTAGYEAIVGADAVVVSDYGPGCGRCEGRSYGAGRDRRAGTGRLRYSIPMSLGTCPMTCYASQMGGSRGGRRSSSCRGAARCRPAPCARSRSTYCTNHCGS
jgi:D-beta-D-heptose 7-phosphate kinase/D-beta-D-heptose 1-phosphate adenosyltransferase